MSGDKLLTTFAAKVGTPPQREEPDASVPDDVGAFGWLRGRERAIMLELRFRTGNIVALSYAWLERIDFDPSFGVTLTFGGNRVVTITGQNLNAEVRPHFRIVDGLTRQKLCWLQEAMCSQLAESGNGQPVVETIEISG